MTRLQARRLPRRTGWREWLPLGGVLVLAPVVLALTVPGGGWPFALGYLALLLVLCLLVNPGRPEVVVEPGDVAVLQRRGLRSLQVRLKKAPEVLLHGHRDEEVALVELSVAGPDRQSITVPLLRLGPAPAVQPPELLQALGDGLARSVRRRSTEAAALLHAQAAHTGPLDASPLARLLPPPEEPVEGGWSNVLDLLGGPL